MHDTHAIFPCTHTYIMCGCEKKWRVHKDGTRANDVDLTLLIYTCTHIPFFNIHIMYACKKFGTCTRWQQHK